MQHGGATVHAGIPRCYPGCLRCCPGNCRLRHGYMPVGPRLRPGVSLHYKTRIKTWSNIIFLLSLSHNSYVFIEKKHRTDTNWTAQPHTVDGDLKVQIKLLEES